MKAIEKLTRYNRFEYIGHTEFRKAIQIVVSI